MSLSEMHSRHVLRIRTVSNADRLYGAYDPSTALNGPYRWTVLDQDAMSLYPCSPAPIKPISALNGGNATKPAALDIDAGEA